MSYKKILLQLKKEMEEDLSRVKSEIETGRLSISGQELTEEGILLMKGYRTCLEAYLFKIDVALENLNGGKQQ